MSWPPALRGSSTTSTLVGGFAIAWIAVPAWYPSPDSPEK
jgi:hypothetical protein